MNEIKFSVFGDTQHYPNVFYTNVPERLEKIRQRAVANNVDMVIHVGDFCHGPSKMMDVVEQYHSFPMPVYHTTGNHEYDLNTLEEVIKAYKLKNTYYYFDKKGFRFIVIDTNNMRIDGKLVHYENGNYFKVPKNGDVAAIGKEQMQWIEETVMSSIYPCVIFSHHSLERIDSGLSEKEMKELWDMLDRVNSDKQRVLMAINGHHHRDFLRIFKNVAFFDINSAAMEWLAEPHDKFPKELTDKYSLMAHSLIFSEPIHAIVTLKEDGAIKIEGMKSGYFMNVDAETIGRNTADKVGRICTSEVLSANIKINMF